MKKACVTSIGAMAALDQAVMRAGTVIPDDQIAADLDEIPRALSRQGRSGRAGAEQRDAQRACPSGLLISRTFLPRPPWPQRQGRRQPMR